MTAEEIANAIRAVELWQNCGHVHPLTCGTNSQHQKLKALAAGDRVVLKCVDCDYLQVFIPSVVLQAESGGLLKDPFGGEA